MSRGREEEEEEGEGEGREGKRERRLLFMAPTDHPAPRTPQGSEPLSFSVPLLCFPGLGCCLHAFKTPLGHCLRKPHVLPSNWHLPTHSPPKSTGLVKCQPQAGDVAQWHVLSMHKALGSPCSNWKKERQAGGYGDAHL